MSVVDQLSKLRLSFNAPKKGKHQVSQRCSEYGTSAQGVGGNILQIFDNGKSRKGLCQELLALFAIDIIGRPWIQQN